MEGRGIATSNFVGYWGRNPRIYEHMGEGYGTGEYYVDHLTWENLVELANWMITLPEEYYRPIAGLHHLIEWHLRHRDRH